VAPGDCRIYLLENALLSKVVLRRGLLREQGIIIAIHPEDETIDVQVERGLRRNVRKYNDTNQPLAEMGEGWFWEWETK
jgi:hypothetical protein